MSEDKRLLLPPPNDTGKPTYRLLKIDEAELTDAEKNYVTRYKEYRTNYRKAYYKEYRKRKGPRQPKGTPKKRGRPMKVKLYV